MVLITLNASLETSQSTDGTNIWMYYQPLHLSDGFVKK